ncbi:MAG TPA: MerR family transcriptional regulator [Methylophaga aminisulfidivorans]|jgi:DNA-binding transcriptional MerR regulator|uniref:MerR family transcriptional regulator n=1 Tax=Methylophaga TaxID=40222 RepID=UPI0005913833|nr:MULTISPECIES: MerR family transcriptional regulator [Methylophaga]HIC45310.1 MerR family transcriptional regulator [Methylophaga sp.]HIM41050.1 MerR family transcriptional regulator [Methylophaga aminisulfidivorans]
MLVNEVAKTLNIGPETVRFYTRIKLLQPQKNRFNGYREYDNKDINRLKFILAARQLGFSVDDIQQILADADKKRSPCPGVRRLLAKRLQETELRFREMQQLRKKMKKALAQWKQMPDMEPTGQMICHLIEEFTVPFTTEEK